MQKGLMQLQLQLLSLQMSKTTSSNIVASES
jgi:hypothetical protein